MERQAGLRATSATRKPAPPRSEVTVTSVGRPMLQDGKPAIHDGKPLLLHRIPVSDVMCVVLHDTQIKSRTVKQLDAKGKASIVGLHLPITIRNVPGDEPAEEAQINAQIHLSDAPLRFADAPHARDIALFIQFAAHCCSHPIPEALLQAISQRVCDAVRASSDSNLGWMLSILLNDLHPDEFTPGQLRAFLRPIIDPATGLSMDQRALALRRIATACSHEAVTVDVIEPMIRCAQEATESCTSLQKADVLAQSVVHAIGPAMLDEPAHLSALHQAIVQLDVQPPTPPHIFSAWLLALGRTEKGRYTLRTVQQVLSLMTAHPAPNHTALCNLVCAVSVQCIDLGAASPKAVRALREVLAWSASQAGEAAGHALSGFVQGLVLQQRLEPRHMTDLVAAMDGLGERITVAQRREVVGELIERLGDRMPPDTPPVREFVAALKSAARPSKDGKSGH